MTDRLRALMAFVFLVAILGLGVQGAASVFLPELHSVLASDDDDDDWDDDDDDWDDDDRPGFGGFVMPDRPFLAPPAPRRAAAPAAAPLPGQAPDEIVVARLDPPDLVTLEALGFTVLAGGALPAPRVLLRIPPGTSVDEAIAMATGVAPAAPAVPNTYYRAQAIPSNCVAEICRTWAEVSWPPAPDAATCSFAPHIGIVDTGVNLEHDMLRNADITIETIGAVGADPSGLRHGTAIVAMFVGDPDGRVPGLVPAARLFVVDPFGTEDGDERADVYGLVTALERLIEAGVAVISLSLSGSDNALLREGVASAQAAGIPVVAAVGNAGPAAPPLFPAAYDGVFAVTAVDVGGSVYRRAVQGPHVQFAAPGVEIATAASISGIRPQTGTSFAVPFVTTAVAAALAAGVSDGALEHLAATAVDLGEPGHDPVFGWGLVQIPSPCGAG
ncbi:MAG: S8 family serine peptidase [Bauldia sp.]|nr:S8 family serine peptidase [Bauldia sp.]